MHLYVEPMDVVLVEMDAEGRVRLKDETEFFTPSLQERRAILYAAKNELSELRELVETLDRS
jgi:hypothetical protein